MQIESKNIENSSEKIQQQESTLMQELSLNKMYANKYKKGADKNDIPPDDTADKPDDISSTKDNESSQAPLKEDKKNVEKSKINESSLETRLKEAQKWGNDAHKREIDASKREAEAIKKLEAYTSKIQRMLDDGDLLEEDGKSLLEMTHTSSKSQSYPPFVRWAEMWDKEVELIKKYKNDPDTDKYMDAFMDFHDNASREELEDLYAEFKKLESDSVASTFKMLDVGREHAEGYFGELHEAGGTKNLIDKYKEKERTLQKSIDKLEEKVRILKNKYEGFTEDPTYNIRSGSVSGEPKSEPTEKISDMYANRFKK